MPSDAERLLVARPTRRASFVRIINTKHDRTADSRVFLDAPLVRSSLAADTNAQPILTYLATLLRAGTTPRLLDGHRCRAPWTPADLRDDEIVAGQWLAEDCR